METTLDIKKRIHEFIDRADDRILRIINAIITTEEFEDGLSTKHKAILDERLKEHSENPASGKSWSKVQKELKEEYGI